VIRGFQLEILLSESDWHLGPLWSGSWTVVDDGVHRPEVVASLFLSFEFHGWPSRNGMIVPKDGKTFEF
jgi:hypothetical protein